MRSVLWSNKIRKEITFDKSSNFVPSANSPVDARLVKWLSPGQGGISWRLIIDSEDESQFGETSDERLITPRQLRPQFL